MTNILTRDEVEALKNAMSQSPAAEDPAIFSHPDADNAKPYDFLNTTVIASKPRALLQIIHDKYASHLARALTAHMNISVDIRVASMEVLPFRDYEETIPNPCTLTTLNFKELGCRSMLVLHPLLGYSIIDRLTGGAGDIEPPERGFTEIEQALIEDTIGMMLPDLKGAWARVQETSIDIEGRFASQQLLKYVPPNESILLVSLEVKIQNTTGLIALCYSEQLLDIISEHLEGADDEEEETEAVLERIQPESVEALSVNAGAFLGTVLVPIREIMMLQPGDVLLLDHKLSEPLDLKVSGRTRFQGYLGKHSGQLTFGITNRK